MDRKTPTARMTHPDPRALACAYLEVKEGLLNTGFSREIDWQASADIGRTTEPLFISECAGVILSSGMRETVIRKSFPSVSLAFLNWRSAKLIKAHAADCRRRALRAFGHVRKIEAIINVATFVATHGFRAVERGIATSGADFFLKFSFLGPVTSLHLAKNLGLPVVKPDRHLQRLAATMGYLSAAELCKDIASVVPDSLPVVDVVLWRGATLNRRFNQRFADLVAAFSTEDTRCDEPFVSDACIDFRSVFG
jgi:hypothetical protein